MARQTSLAYATQHLVHVLQVPLLCLAEHHHIVDEALSTVKTPQDCCHDPLEAS